MDVIEALPQVLAGFDEPIADVVAGELGRHVRLRPGSRLDSVGDGDGGLTALVDGQEERTDLVVLATGVRPASGLLTDAGARHLPDGSVVVDSGMRTSLPGVFAAGDCVAAAPGPGPARPGCRSGPPPTRPAGSPERSPPAARPRSPAWWAPR